MNLPNQGAVHEALGRVACGKQAGIRRRRRGGYERGRATQAGCFEGRASN